MRAADLNCLRAFLIVGVCLSATNLSAQAPPAVQLPSAYGEPPRIQAPTVQPEDESIRNTAISLNYCRASFHRIRKYPVKPVLAEEQEKILNNLNLQGIEDPEVIQLYTSVLDEIGQIEIADRERYVTKANHSNSLQRKVTWDLLAVSADLATGQYGNAVRQGANSWWDYRGMEYQKESDLLRVEKTRMQSVTQKSSTFLDTFWKLARRKNIPDRWLVRGDDLDALEAAMQEKNAETRLRVLKRMEPYMQAYPPYWYYVARTEQELGALIAASATYERLADIGEGHFRKDDMLATSLANLAAIQDHLGSPNAVMTASRALEFSTDVWETNLICSRVLERHGRIADAEDAILRNLDVGLETDQSRVFLASLYIHADDRTKLARMLQRPDMIAGLPAPVLLRCAACLGPERTPQPVMQAVLASLDVQPRQQFGGEELAVRLSPAWQLHLARVDVAWRGQRLTPVPAERVAEGFLFRYPMRPESQGAVAAPSADSAASISFIYPDETVVQVALQGDAASDNQRAPLGFFPVRTSASRTTSGPLRVSTISVNNTRIAVTPSSAWLSPSVVPEPYPGRVVE